jgi:G6PDH family F420-dependent oxidoreductase
MAWSLLYAAGPGDLFGNARRQAGGAIAADIAANWTGAHRLTYTCGELSGAAHVGGQRASLPGSARRKEIFMVKLGYKLMSEEHGPNDLVRNAGRAEAAGFDFAAISDHFFPWLAEQGHSPLAWSVLGAIAQTTSRLGLMTAVTCPTMRYHPAIVAQGAATVSLLSGGRFTLGLGAGERLNEHIVGTGWPGRAERQERLAEALDIIQGLLAGTLQNYRGKHLVLDHAWLFDRPKEKPPVIVAIAGPRGAATAATKADGLIATEPKRDLIAAYTQAGGKGPRYCEVAMCYAAREDEAKKTAHKYFRWSLAGWPVMAELPDPEGFAAASRSARLDDIAESISCGPSAEKHLQAVDKYLQAGFDHIILTQIGPQQEAFVDFFARELKPALRAKKAA